MARGFTQSSYSAGEEAVKARKMPDAPTELPEFGLPDITGKTLDDIKALGGVTSLYQKSYGIMMAKYAPESPPREVYDRFTDYHDKLYKYSNRLKNLEKEAEKAERAAKKSIKEANKDRIKQISTGIVTSLEPQEKAMATRILEHDIRKVEILKERIKKYDGKSENMPASVEKALDEEEFVKSTSGNEFGIVERFKDENGKWRGKYTYSIDEEKTDPVKLKANAERLSRQNIEAFAQKLVQKTEAEAGEGEQLVGSPIVRHSSTDPWSDSTIEINTTNRKIIWKTNMILNFSKYHNAFNQWPTRLVENEKRG